MSCPPRHPARRDFLRAGAGALLAAGLPPARAAAPARNARVAIVTCRGYGPEVKAALALQATEVVTGTPQEFRKVIAESLAANLLRDSWAHTPTVLAGDLNTWAPAPWERAVAILRTHFPAGNITRGPTYAGPPIGVGRTLDYMMFRLPVIDRDPRRHAGPGDGTASDVVSFAPPVSVRLDDARGSDHFPLLARLQLIDAP
jgi:endonuclease/exonuclease/phosphatase (EEP) superfamily protein YafD